MLKKNRATIKDIQNVNNRGIIKNTPLFSIRISTQKIKNGKVSIVVSKKISKKAVDRNTIKRKIRHLFSDINIPNYKTIIVYLKKDIVHVSSKIIKETLKKSLE